MRLNWSLLLAPRYLHCLYDSYGLTVQAGHPYFTVTIWTIRVEELALVSLFILLTA